MRLPMFFKICNWLSTIVQKIRICLSPTVKRDRQAFNIHTEDTVVQKIQVSDISLKYTLARKNNTIYLSTACPLFIWKGIGNNSKYFMPRIPSLKNNYSREFRLNNACSCGYKLIFSTNSSFIDINILLKKIIISRNMSLQALAGIDVYEITEEDHKWLGCYAPNNFYDLSIRCHIHNSDKKIHTYLIFLPIFSQTACVKVGLEKSSYIYNISSNINLEAPIAIYGSSITQGCACSRPALSYANQLSLSLKQDVLNFGFSGSARGESEIAANIASQKISAIVMEYDHNVDLGGLEKTHYNFYSILRKNKLNVPIILLSRCSGGFSVSAEEEEKRFKIISSTYHTAIANGDHNIYLLRGDNLFDNKEKCLVDDRHPNDYGIKILSQTLTNTLHTIGDFNGL